MRSVLGRNHAATVPLRVRHVLAWQERVFSVRKARIRVSEFHSRAGLHFSFVSLSRGLPSPRRLRSARSWSRSHARDTSLLPGPIFRGDACDWASYVAKHAQQARRATRVVRANGQVGVCSDDLEDGLLGRSERSWEIRKASQRQKRRKGNVCRRGENRRPWKAEGGGRRVPALRHMSRKSALEGINLLLCRFSDATADEEGLPTLLGGNGAGLPPGSIPHLDAFLGRIDTKGAKVSMDVCLRGASVRLWDSTPRASVNVSFLGPDLPWIPSAKDRLKGKPLHVDPKDQTSVGGSPSGFLDLQCPPFGRAPCPPFQPRPSDTVRFGSPGFRTGRLIGQTRRNPLLRGNRNRFEPEGATDVSVLST